MRRLLLAALVLFAPSSAGAQTWQWVSGPTITPQPSYRNASGVAPAPGSDTYAVGDASEAIAWGADTVESGGFLARLDDAGSPVWMRATGWRPRAASDAEGFLYVAQIVTAPLVAGDTTLAPFGGMDIVVTKHAPDGSLVWARRAGGPNSDLAYGLAVGYGRVCTTGGIVGTVTFDGIVLAHPNTLLLRPFVACWNSDGTIAWATSTTTAGGVIALAVAVGPQGVFASGNAADPFTVAGITVPTSNDGYVLAFDHNGSLRWAEVAASNNQSWATGLDVAADDGTLYIAGHFGAGTLTLGGRSVATSRPSAPFLARMRTDGTAEWLRSVNLGLSDEVVRLAVAPSGEAYLGGSFLGTAILGTTTLTAVGSRDLFMASFSPGGDVLWARRAGGTGPDAVHALAVAPSSGDVLVAAETSSPADFGPLVYTGGPIGFARLSGASVSTEAMPETGGLLALSAPSPNPASAHATATLHLAEAAQVRVTLADALGRTVAVVHDGPLAAGAHRLALDASSLAPGVYVLRAEGLGAVATTRLAVVR